MIREKMKKQHTENPYLLLLVLAICDIVNVLAIVKAKAPYDATCILGCHNFLLQLFNIFCSKL